MSGDDSVSLIAAALTRLADAFDQYNILCRERLDRDFPPEKPKRAPEIISTETERNEQYSDQATEQWMRDTQAALDNQQPSRFQKRFDESEHPAPPPRRRRTVEVPERN